MPSIDTDVNDGSVEDTANAGYYMLAESIVLLTMAASISIVGYWLVTTLYEYQITLTGITYNEGYKQLGIGACIGIASWAVGLAIGGLA